ncbi:hypothetical protein ACI798_04445 [Geodermatophilus sp. SYSU D01045]
MRTPRRLATAVLALTAGASLAACSTAVSGSATPVSQGSEASTEPAAPPVEETGGTEPVTDPAPGTEPAPGSGSVPTSDEDLPVPGAGVPGDEGLCQAVAGWFGYVGLSLISVDETGYVDPAGVVPLLEALRDAPAGHRDASAPVLAAADAVSAATDAAIDDVQSGGDVITAVTGLTGPVTEFGTACAAAGVSV